MIQESNNNQLKEAEEVVEWDETTEEDEDARVDQLGLIGKIWTSHHINSNAFISTMTNKCLVT